MARTFFWRAVLSAAFVRALAYPEPRATGAIVTPLDAQSPAPTAAPAFHELLKRQNGNGQTVLVAPDNTCGFVGAQLGAAYTCIDPKALCVFITASGTGAAGCCGAVDCGFRVACYDYDQVYSSKLCDKQCSTDTFTEKCTDTAARYCGTLAFPNGATDYFCHPTKLTTVWSADFTYSGQTGRTLASTVLTEDISGVTQKFITVTTTATPPPTGGTTSGSSSSSTNVGAIVGGVVGGIAVLGLLGLGAFFLVRQKKKTTKFEPVPSQPPGSETTQHNIPPGSPDPSVGKPGHQSIMSAYSAAPPYGTPTPPPGSGYQYPVGAYGAATSPPAHQQGFPQQGYGQPGMPVVYEAGGRPVHHAPAEMDAAPIRSELQ